MAGVALADPRQQYLDASGNPLAGGFVHIYLAGTTTRSDTWQDRAQTTLNTNPIELDAAGACLIVLDSALTYKRVVTNAAGAEQAHLYADNIVGAAGASILADAIADIESARDDAIADIGTAQDTAEESIAEVSARLTEQAEDVANGVGTSARPVYATTAAGLAVTTEAQKFYVPHSTIDNMLVQYENLAGVATDTGRRFNQTTGVEIGTAISLMDTEVEGIAIDATCADSIVRVKVIDSVTPANDYEGDLLGFLATTCFPTAKMVTLEDGTFGWSDHNFFFDCARPDGANWTRTSLTAGAPSGGYSTLTTTASPASARQNVTVLERGYYYCLNYVVKAGTSPFVYLRVQTSFSDLYAYFNISAGTVGTVDAGLTATIHTTDVDGTALAAGDYRCQVVHKAGTGGAFASFVSHIGLADADAATAVTVGRTALFRKSQSNWGAKPTGYIETTAGARYGVPYDWSTGTRRVLIEEIASAYHSRYGDDLTQAAFWTATNITPTLTATGPHGEPCSVLTATASDGTILQSFTSSTATNTFQARVKRRTGVGVIEMTADGGATWTAITSQINSTSYSRVYVHRSDAAMNIGFRIRTSGDAIDVALAVNSNRGIILSPMPTYDPGVGSFYLRAADSFRIATTKFNLGTQFTFFVDYEISGDTAAASEQAGVIGASDIHSITRADQYYVSRSSSVSATAANNFLCDSPNSTLRVEGAMRIKANDYAATANGTSEVYDNRLAVGTLTNIFAGSATGQLFLRRLLLVPRSLADDSLQSWRWSGTGEDSRYLADIKVAKHGEVASTHINREPNVEVLADNDQYALLSVMHMQRYVTANPSTGEAPGRLVQKIFRFNKTTEALSLESGPVVVAEQASWASGLGHQQGIAQCKVKYGAKKGRLIALYAQLDTADGLISPDHRRLYTKYSDDNGATWSAATMIYDPGAGKYAVPVGSGQAIQFSTGANAGRIVFPIGTDATVADRVGVVYSDDGGVTWTVVATTNSGYEPTLHFLPDGTTAVMTIRVESSPWRIYATSTDGCATWSATSQMTSLAAEGTNVAMAMVQNEPEGDSGLYGEQLLVGVRQNSAPYPLRSKLTIEEVTGSTLTVSGTQFTPIGVYRACGYTSAQRLSGGYLAIGYESSPTGVTNNFSDIRLMVISWP